MWGNSAFNFRSLFNLHQNGFLLISYFILNHKDATVRNLNRILAEFPELTCLGITADYEEGMNTILKMTPDVIFINIDDFSQQVSHENVFSY